MTAAAVWHSRLEIPIPTRELGALQKEALKFLTCGLTNYEIGKAMGLNSNTVKAMLFKVYDKIGMSNRVDAAFWYVAHFGDPR